MNNLKDKLLEIGKECQRVSKGNLNFGGCAVYAAEVAKVLDQLGVPVKGIVLTNGWMEEADLDKVRPADSTNMANWNAAGLYFTHVGLEVDIHGVPHIVDSDFVEPRGKGSKSLYDYTLLKGHLSLKELEGIASDEDWNPRFDRKLIPEVRKIVEKVLTNAPEQLDWVQMEEDDNLLKQLEV